MKRLIITMVAVCLAVSVFAQAQITTKKEKLSDFTVKTTKVVLTGNVFVDEALRNAAKNAWTISPYEICTAAEFESLRSSDKYYFLLPVEVKSKGDIDGGLTFLTLVKGGAGKTVSDMLEVVSVPVCAADFPSGREMAFFPSILDIMQSYVENSLVSGFNGLKAVKSISRSAGMSVYFIEEDLSDQVTDEVRGRVFGKLMTIVDEETQSNIISDGSENALVSYTVVPSEPVKGSVCYKMLIDARTHELYYYAKHQVSEKNGAGFLKSEVQHIGSKR